MGNEHCPICGADAETPDKAFFYYECGFTVNRQSGAVIRHCKNEELVEANKRIAALEAENAALHSRLEFTSCQKADVEAQVLELEEQIAALRQDAAVGRALTDAYKHFYEVWLGGVTLEETIKKHRRVFGKTDITDALIRILNAEKQYAALEAAGLVEEEQDA